MSVQQSIADWYLSLINGANHTIPEKAVLTLLEFVSKVYEHGVRKRYAAYVSGKRTTQSLPVPVISIGNITMGGTGKTPMACWIAKWLQRERYRLAVLNRGYRSAGEKKGAVVSDGRQVFLTPEDGGDEACLLARSLPGVPVLVGKNRGQTGSKAIRDFHAQVLLLDDGYQHWQLGRNLDIVLIDGTDPVGNGEVLPRGSLREPVEGLERADIFIITKADIADEEDKEKIYTLLRHYNQEAPIAEAVHKPKWCVPFADWLQGNAAGSLSEDSGVVALSALGNPTSFEETLREMEYEVRHTVRFPDHHRYGSDDLLQAAAVAAEKKAVLVTTEKDAVKMDGTFIMEHEIELYVLGIEIEIIAGRKELEKLLKRTMEDMS